MLMCLSGMLCIPNQSAAFILSGHVKYIADDPDGWD